MNGIKAKIIDAAVFAAAVLFVLGITSCDLLNIVTGNGNIQTKNYNPEGFTAISCSGKWTVHIDYGTDFSIKITSDENLFPFFDVFNAGDTLYVKDGSFNFRLRDNKSPQLGNRQCRRKHFRLRLGGSVGKKHINRIYKRLGRNPL